MKVNLDGKVALVTGASSGIGKAIALELGRQGANVGVVYHAEAEAARAVVDEVKRDGRQVIAVQADVSRAADVCRLGEHLSEDDADRRHWLVYRRTQAVRDRTAGDVEATRRSLEEALDLATAISLPGQEWEIGAELAGVSRAAGDSIAAEAALDRSLETIKALAESIGDEPERERFRAAAKVRARALARVSPF